MEKQPETTYRVIGAGVGEWSDGGSFSFNRPGFHSTLAAAVADYNELYSDPTYDSAVLVEVQHEDWRVLQEFGTEGLSVTMSPQGVIHLDTAPKLELV